MPRGNQDFDALGSLVETLSKIASLDLKQSTGTFEATGVDLHEILTDLRIVLDPCCEESGIQLHWTFLRICPWCRPIGIAFCRCC